MAIQPQPQPQPPAAAQPDPKDEIKAVLAAARLANPRLDILPGRTHVMVPDGFRLVDVDHPDFLPDHVAQDIRLDTAESLIRYVNRFADPRTILIGDYDAGTICARIDWHAASDQKTPATAAHDRHAATLCLRPSEEFQRWNKLAGKMQSQADFARFLEENATDICDPDPAVMIEISRDLEAIQGVNFRSSVRLENGDRAFVYETETKTKGDLRVPREFAVDIPLWQGEPRRVIRCALRWRVEAGGLALGFEWRRVEYVRQARFQELAHEVSEATGRPLIFGRVPT